MTLSVYAAPMEREERLTVPENCEAMGLSRKESAPEVIKAFLGRPWWGRVFGG